MAHIGSFMGCRFRCPLSYRVSGIEFAGLGFDGLGFRGFPQTCGLLLKEKLLEHPRSLNNYLDAPKAHDTGMSTLNPKT